MSAWLPAWAVPHQAITLALERPVIRVSQILAIADFKAGVYELAGEASSLEAMFVEGDDFLYSQVIPGLGWRVVGNPTGTDGGYAKASPELLAIIGGGTTVKLEFAMAEGTDATELGLSAADDFTAATEERLCAFYMPLTGAPYLPYIGTIIEQYEPPDAVAEYDYFDFEDEPGMLHRFVATLTDPQLDYSIDGRPSFTVPGLVLGNGALPGDFWLSNFAGHGEQVIERAVFYRPKPPADLPALSAVPPPPPPLAALAIADFKGGVYELNGEPSSLAAMTVEGGGYLYTDVVNGTGFVQSVGVGGGSKLASMVFSAAVHSTLMPTGFTATFDFRWTETLVPGSQVYTEIGCSSDVEWKAAGFQFQENLTYLMLAAYDYDVPSYDYDLQTNAIEPSDTLMRLVATLTEEGVDAAYNGNEVFSITGATPMTSELALTNLADHANLAMSTIIEKVTFYPPQPPEDLPALSSPPGARRARKRFQGKPGQGPRGSRPARRPGKPRR